jgi:hypothetical protein
MMVRSEIKIVIRCALRERAFLVLRQFLKQRSKSLHFAYQCKSRWCKNRFSHEEEQYQTSAICAKRG